VTSEAVRYVRLIKADLEMLDTMYKLYNAVSRPNTKGKPSSTTIVWEDDINKEEFIINKDRLSSDTKKDNCNNNAILEKFLEDENVLGLSNNVVYK
jgi:hypothetical protein